MTIRFTARAGSLAPRLDRWQVRALAIRPVNDNHDCGADEDALGAALRHFARHGMAAARLARDHAESALSAGDQPAYAQWHAICRALDRTMARKINMIDKGEPTGLRRDSRLTSR